MLSRAFLKSTNIAPTIIPLSRFRVTDLKRKQPTVLNFFMYGIEVVINERFISTSLSHVMWIMFFLDMIYFELSRHFWDMKSLFHVLYVSKPAEALKWKEFEISIDESKIVSLTRRACEELARFHIKVLLWTS